MTNEEIQEIVAKADAEYDRLKDRVHEQYDEIKRLKDDLYEANDSVTWWNNRYNAIVKQNDDNHKKLVKEQEKIEKAIEHIEKVKDMYTINEVVNQVGIPILDISIEIWKKELLDILKGSDKE